MKHILEFRELLKGGKADGLTLKGVAKKHKMKVTPELELEFKIGQAVELEHTDDRKKANEIALDHLSEDPLYYTKLIKSGVVDEPDALKIYQGVK